MILSFLPHPQPWKKPAALWVEVSLFGELLHHRLVYCRGNPKWPTKEKVFGMFLCLVTVFGDECLWNMLHHINNRVIIWLFWFSIYHADIPHIIMKWLRFASSMYFWIHHPKPGRFSSGLVPWGPDLRSLVPPISSRLGPPTPWWRWPRSSWRRFRIWTARQRRDGSEGGWLVPKSFTVFFKQLRISTGKETA